MIHFWKRRLPAWPKKPLLRAFAMIVAIVAVTAYANSKPADTASSSLSKITTRATDQVAAQEAAKQTIQAFDVVSAQMMATESAITRVIHAVTADVAVHDLTTGAKLQPIMIDASQSIS